MTTAILSIIGSALTLAVLIAGYLFDKKRKQQKELSTILKKGQEANEKLNTTGVVDFFTRAKRMRNNK